MLDIVTDGHLTIDDCSATVDFADVSFLEVNGRELPVDNVALAAQMLNDRADTSQVVSIPAIASVGNGRLHVEQPTEVLDDGAGGLLAGKAAVAAIERANDALRRHDALQGDFSIGGMELDYLDRLVSKGGWDGPLIISMPRTGSTLLGTLFLLASDSDDPSGFRFDRYIHEPAAPLFWQGRELKSLSDTITTPLTKRDVVQESAYQFASYDIARWFIRSARKPIVFVMRHPQISWPSRWRIMLKNLVETDSPDVDRIRLALETDDFIHVGDLLATVKPPDNGFYAYLELLSHCLDDGIDFVIVDNARFRRDPDAVLRKLCERLDITYDRAMTTWTDLSRARGRVVMSDLALEEEYPSYYAGTFESSHGIVRKDRSPLPIDRFPDALRRPGGSLLSIEEAVTWYHMLLARPETLA